VRSLFLGWIYTGSHLAKFDLRYLARLLWRKYFDVAYCDSAQLAALEPLFDNVCSHGLVKRTPKPGSLES